MDNAIRRARVDAGLTQVALATLAGLPQATISRLETVDGVVPSWRVVQRVSEALGVDPKHLFGDHSSPSGPTA